MLTKCIRCWLVAKPNKHNQGGSLRIVGGSWRGRKLSFPDVHGLRPTSDRIRETVFNWLQFYIGDSRCLDLFAGSGALGLEAASRGAARVDLVEADTSAYRQLQQSKQVLAADNCQLFHTQAQTFLQTASDKYDIVFVDPPYQADLWSEVAKALVDKSLLNDGARIYLEYPRQQVMPELPESWILIKDKKAGDVKYCLFEYQAEAN